MDPDFLRDLFADFGTVEVRRLFGGAGLFADGVMFGLVSGGQIYLKADPETAPRFEAEGCGPFEYGTKTGKRAIASFRRLPDRLYDDAEELAQWARAALAVARKNATGKPAAKARSKRKKAVKIRRPSTSRRRR
jgi:DNA transformation protein and related proteins